jgi:anaerobic magnesium-protoporphyrin IX monomethyl ester cyclase
MRILLINPPYQTLTSNRGVGHQIPFGLLAVGGPLLDAGHTVQLLDAECLRLSLRQIVAAAMRFQPDVIMTGHAGSTPAHPITMKMLAALKAARPGVVTVYGGPYPTYQAAPILAAEPAVDVIVRGEGEAVAVSLVVALDAAGLDAGAPLSHALERCAGVAGLALRSPGGALLITPDAPAIDDLDRYRVGWELIEDWDRYHCFGLGRAGIIQFSRGCPHRCTYCGQHSFWQRWRYRDPIRLADEIEWLYRTHDLRFFTLADENPTTLIGPWQRLLKELAARRLPVYFFATIRATDIVRDAATLDLYRRAGILYVLMGIESTNADVLTRIRKRSDPQQDYLACQLLKQHGIFSVIGHIVGFAEESLPGFRIARRVLAHYDGDYLNAMYATPHPWTRFGDETASRQVVEDDLSKWDYRHQVLAQTTLSPWAIFAAVKWLEVCFHLRPRRLWAFIRERDPLRRQQMWWGLRHTSQVWLGEVVEFGLRNLRRRPTLTVDQVYGRESTDTIQTGAAQRQTILLE